MTRRGPKPPSQRQLRVGEELRHALSAILERETFRDPALAGVTITVTEVRVGADLRTATVYVMPLGGKNVAEALQGLGRVKSFLRHRIASEVQLKFVPDLHFRADDSFDRVDKIERLFRDPAVARDLGSDRDEGDDA